MVKRKRLTAKERDERKSRLFLGEEAAAREYRKRLQVIKDKLDAYGEEALTPEEHVLVSKHYRYFYPEGG